MNLQEGADIVTHQKYRPRQNQLSNQATQHNKSTPHSDSKDFQLSGTLVQKMIIGVQQMKGPR